MIILGQPGAIGGDPDTSIYFDGVSGQLQLPASLANGASDYSFGGWIMPAAAYPATGLTNSIWTHFFCTYNITTGQSKLYLNGTLNTSAAASVTLGTANSLFNGWVDELVFFGSELSAARVQAQYINGLARHGDNGAITNLITNGIEQKAVTLSMGFDDLTEANYLQIPAGIVDSESLTSDLVGYRVLSRDPATLTNRQLFNVASSSLSSAINSSVTSLAIANAADFLNAGYLKLDSEYMQYTGKGSPAGRPPALQTWSGVAYGAGLWVGVAADGSVSTSPDAITWTPRTAAEPNAWNAVIFANSLFVAVASSGTHRVMTSPDGITWTARTAASASSWLAIAWSPSLSLFAAAGTGVMMTSPDGTTWTSRTSLGASTIAWSPDLALFSTVTETSTNGTTWVSRKLQVDQGVTCLNWNATLSLFIAAGNGPMWTSPDGLTWTSRTAAISAMVGAASNASIWVMVSSFDPSGSGSGNIQTSTDGITWTGRTSALATVLHGVAWAPSLSLFCSVGKGNGTNDIQTSGDGITWTQRGGKNTELYGVAWSPSLSLFAAISHGLTTNGIFTSPDGITWTGRVAAEANTWNSIVWAPSIALFVAVSNDGTHRVQTSPDGTNWTARTAASADSWMSVTWSVALSLLVAVGANAVMTSPDGINWTTRTPLGTAEFWANVEWSPSLAIFVSTTSAASTTYFPMHSADGSSWSAVRAAASGNTWAGIAWSTSLTKFVAVASATGTQSSDGINWTPMPHAATTTFDAVAWSSSLALFAAVSTSGAVQTSANGTSWTSRTAAAANGWTSIAFANSLFVAMANTGDNRAQSSADGVTWGQYLSTLTGLTRGMFGTTAAAHAVNATVLEMIYYNAHIMDIAVSALTNTDKTGLSVPSAQVDSATAATIKSALGSMTATFYITAQENGKAWLEKELYQVAGIVPIMKGGIYSWYKLSVPSVSVMSIGPDDIIKDSNKIPLIGWDRNFRSSIINLVQYQLDWNGTTYLTTSTAVVDSASITANGTTALIIQSKGLRSANAGTYDFMAAVAAIFIGRYKNGAPNLTIQTTLAKGIVEPGDIVAVTSDKIPNRTTKTRGVTGALMEVVGRALALEAGHVDLNLIWPGW